MQGLRSTAALAVLASAGFLLAGCGGGSSEVAKTEARQMVIELSRAIVKNDKPTIEKLVMLDAGIEGVNPAAAAEMETKEGRAHMREGNRRFLRRIWRDAGIEDLSAVDRFGESLTMSVGGSTGKASFEFQKEDSKFKEICILHLRKNNGVWQVSYYDRKIADR